MIKHTLCILFCAVTTATVALWQQSTFITLGHASPPSPCLENLLYYQSNTYSDLNRYEAFKDITLKPTKQFTDFHPQQGISVTSRDPQGNPLTGKIRVLSQNPNDKIYIIGEWNGWGAGLKDEDILKPIAGTSYFETSLKLKHKMEYRLLVNGQQVIDPAADVYTTPEYYFKTSGKQDSHLNCVFWDHEGAGMPRIRSPPVDLTDKPHIIGETGLPELVRYWKQGAQIGPPTLQETYKFITNSGVIKKLKQMGYNAIEFLPFNASVDGADWRYRYQVFGLFAPDSRYGTPQEFAEMISAFNKEGIGIIMDAVVGHYPFRGNIPQSVRDLAPIGIHQWKKADGHALYGSEGSPWGTYRYDYTNPQIRRFLTDSILNMIKRYGLSGIRFDNLDGIRFANGGTEFIKELTSEIRAYQPKTLLIGEMFFGENKVLQSLDQGGLGINFRTNSDFFDFIKDYLRKSTEELDLNILRERLRKPWDWGEAPRINYLTNHDEAANARDGATGSYLASLLNGGGWDFVVKKIKAWNTLAMTSGSSFMDMPQLRLLEEGSFNGNPDIEWHLEKFSSQSQTNTYFSDLSHYVQGNDAFAFQNFHANIENHIDNNNKILSLLRVDKKTGKKIYIIINLSHKEFSNYRFGVDVEGSLKVVLDSDQSKYGGSNRLMDMTNGKPLNIDPQGEHGKPQSVVLPHISPFSAVVLEH